MDIVKQEASRPVYILRGDLFVYILTRHKTLQKIYSILTICLFLFFVSVCFYFTSFLLSALKMTSNKNNANK